MAHNPRRTNGNLRNKVRARVLREEDTCWLCGKPVDKTLHMHDPGAPQVDEIIPVSKGGSPYDRKNCHLSHALCNQRRGNGDREWKPPAPTQPLRTSRQWDGSELNTPSFQTAHPMHPAEAIPSRHDLMGQCGVFEWDAAVNHGLPLGCPKG